MKVELSITWLDRFDAWDATVVQCVTEMKKIEGICKNIGKNKKSRGAIMK